jgi:hypothetical protein
VSDFLRRLLGYERVLRPDQRGAFGLNIYNGIPEQPTFNRYVDTSHWEWQRWRPWWAMWRRPR